MKEAKYTTRAIANWFVWYDNIIGDTSEGDLSASTKLEKLMYYAQGKYLGLYGQALFAEDFVADEYGVSLPSVHKEYRQNFCCGTSSQVFPEKISEIEEIDQKFLLLIYDGFTNLSANALDLLSRSEKPWRTTNPDSVITKEKIRKYFEHKYLRLIQSPPKRTAAEEKDEEVLKGWR